MIEMTLRSVGNPDFGQYAPLSPKLNVTVATLDEAKAAAQAYIDEHDLGGGNFVDPKLVEDGKLIGYLSYNMRFWTVAEWSVNHAPRRA
jgi:hypothetical protein